jgi:predicted pyridoxine 5'-phosphate oxidase superfamily flavin-nucleotide-binding protein
MAGFHAGELAVQRRAGVEAEAARLTGMLAAPDLRGGLGRFLAGRTYAAMTARATDGRLWVSPLTGPAGFLAVTGPTTLEIAAAPGPPDPLAGLRAGQPVGLLVIEYAARRRARINGTLVTVGRDGLGVEVAEAYGNCPQYIPPRVLVVDSHESATDRPARTALDAGDRRLVEAADSFVFGTTHLERGNDASHRGGRPGFVDVDSDGTVISWPDFPGNQMFNSFGNLEVDPSAALLFVDWTTGATLHLSGTAAVAWRSPDARKVAFTVEAAVSGAPLGLREA